jgi:hypothetical protein
MAGYIQVSFTNVPGKKEIQTRIIRLALDNAPHGAAPAPPLPSGMPGTEREPDPPAVEAVSPRGGDKNVTTYGQNCQEVVTKMSEGDDKSVRDNITSNITKNTSSSPPEKPEPGREEAEKILNPKEQLKTVFRKINPQLVFDPAFYPKAAAFLASHDFADEYLIWLYEFCLEHEPKNLAGFYFTLFFSEQAVELYLGTRKKHTPLPLVSCPVCGCEHTPDLDCPQCGLKQSSAPETIAQHTVFWNLPEDMKSSFTRRQEEILNSSFDFLSRKKSLDRLRHEYGLA